MVVWTGLAPVAPVTVAAITETLPVPQSGSVTRSYWYQTTPTLPALPAVTHGQSTRWPACRATVRGALQVWPPSVETAIWTEFASGVAADEPLAKASLPESCGGRPLADLGLRALGFPSGV